MITTSDDKGNINRDIVVSLNKVIWMSITFKQVQISVMLADNLCDLNEHHAQIWLNWIETDNETHKIQVNIYRNS